MADFIALATLKASNVTTLGAGNFLSEPSYVVPTGIPPVDWHLLGIGGIPGGRWFGVSGPRGCGKTSWLLHLLAQTQRMGGDAYLDETEFTVLQEHMRLLRCQDNIVVSWPNYLEEWLASLDERMRKHTDRRKPLMVGLDTLTNLPTKAEFDAGITTKVKKQIAAAADEGADEEPKSKAGKSAMGDRPRILSAAFRVVPRKLAQSGAIVGVNHQLRANIGVMFGPKTMTPGGHALAYNTSLEFQYFGPGKAVKKGAWRIGKLNKLWVTRNKSAVTEWRNVPTYLMDDVGFDADRSLTAFAKEWGDMGKREKANPLRLQQVLQERNWNYVDTKLSLLSWHNGVEGEVDEDVSETDDDAVED